MGSNVISSKNDIYSELTAQYWIYNNNQSDFVGIEHYRRYLVNQNDQLLTTNEILNELKNVDMLVRKPMNGDYLLKSVQSNMLNHYGRTHAASELMSALHVMLDIYPSYKDAFFEAMQLKEWYISNMFITSNKIFNDYSEWLFNILFEVEKIIDFNQYSDYQKRTLGFLSERLFNVYIMHNQTSTKSYKIKKID